MTDDRPKPHLNVGTIGSGGKSYVAGCVLCKAGIAQSLTQMVKANDALGRKVIIVTTADDLSESLLEKLSREAEKFNATIMVSTAPDPTPNVIELKRVMEQTPGINDCCGNSGPSGSNGIAPGLNRANWLHGDDQPWKRKKRRR